MVIPPASLSCASLARDGKILRAFRSSDIISPSHMVGNALDSQFWHAVLICLLSCHLLSQVELPCSFSASREAPS